MTCILNIFGHKPRKHTGVYTHPMHAAVEVHSTSWRASDARSEGRGIMETKSVAVMSRMTPAQAARLDEVKAMKPALGSRSEAVRRLVDMHMNDGVGTDDAAEGKEVVLGAAAAADLVRALDARTREYNELARQVSAVGNLLNQIARVGNQMVKYDRKGYIAPDAITDPLSNLEAIRDRLAVLAHQDTYVDEVIKRCL